MTCFQICTFVGSSTGSFFKCCRDIMLWLAFKFVPLLGHQQEWGGDRTRTIGCDLLSNLYLCWVINRFNDLSLKDLLLWLAFKFVPLLGHQQGKIYQKKQCIVVTCFQICTFVGSSTGYRTKISTIVLLWLAFKFVPLLGHQQVINIFVNVIVVVTCFQICTFVGPTWTRTMT